MRRPSVVFILLATSALLYPACDVSVGDGDFTNGDGDGDSVGGEGGESTASGGATDGGANSGSGGHDSGSGGSVDDFVPVAFVAPKDMPAALPEVVRTSGYASDSPALRIRDAFRATYNALNKRLTDECEWGDDGLDHRLDIAQYQGLCGAACMVEHLSCDDDAELYVCDVVDSTNASTDLAICLSECEVFTCDDDSSSSAARCDFEIDCADGSDEDGCGDLAFMCDDQSASVSGFAVCDGEDDCDDGSDEENCGFNGFVCENGDRIQGAFQCDGAEDCLEGEDEANCGDLVFSCGDGFLIPWYKTCDDSMDCPDGRDEGAGCVNLDPDMTCTY